MSRYLKWETKYLRSHQHDLTVLAVLDDLEGYFLEEMEVNVFLHYNPKSWTQTHIDWSCYLPGRPMRSPELIDLRTLLPCVSQDSEGYHAAACRILKDTSHRIRDTPPLAPCINQVPFSLIRQPLHTAQAVNSIVRDDCTIVHNQPYNEGPPELDPRRYGLPLAPCS